LCRPLTPLAADVGSAAEASICENVHLWAIDPRTDAKLSNYGASIGPRTFDLVTLIKLRSDRHLPPRRRYSTSAWARPRFSRRDMAVTG